MPTVGLEYRYPFINVQPWGTQTVEPIAQVIVRPNETYAGKLPNEDAQSLVFDASNLFSGRQILRLRPRRRRRPRQCRRAGDHAIRPRRLRQRAVRPVLPAVRHELLRGRATRPIPGSIPACENRALRLCRAASTIQPNRTYTFTSRTRLDEATLNVNRFEAEGRASFDRWSVSMMYGNYAAQPELGYPDPPRGLARHRLGQGGRELGGVGRGALGS